MHIQLEIQTETFRKILDRGRKEMIVKPKFEPKELLEEAEKGNI